MTETEQTQNHGDRLNTVVSSYQARLIRINPETCENSDIYYEWTTRHPYGMMSIPGTSLTTLEAIDRYI